MLLKNSSYYYGGGADSSTLSNCTLIGNSVGNNSTSYGGGANNSILYNCMLISNAVFRYGGGARSSTLNNCELDGNSAASGGGGVDYCTLNYCTLTGNSSASLGGGSRNSTLNNCTVSANSGYNGGGAAVCTLNNCALINNSAVNVGGGAYSTYLTNCTVSGNKGSNGGGTLGCTLSLCIVYFNQAPTNPEYDTGDTLVYCCTTPLPTSGVGNFTNVPLFVDMTGGNFRLQTNSPCIGAGNNDYASGTNDLDGGPRIVNGTVDIGAYEFRGSLLPYYWLQQYGLPTGGSADLVDTDQDGMNNWQEWICGTDPTNSLSLLKMLSLSNNNAGVTVNWQSASGKTYYLQRGTNLLLQPAFSSLQSNILGQADMASFTDTTATNAGPYFYRVGVQ